jgi:hypothetical protein
LNPSFPGASVSVGIIVVAGQVCLNQLDGGFVGSLILSQLSLESMRLLTGQVYLASSGEFRETFLTGVPQNFSFWGLGWGDVLPRGLECLF